MGESRLSPGYNQVVVPPHLSSALASSLQKDAGSGVLYPQLFPTLLRCLLCLQGQGDISWTNKAGFS